MKAALKQLPQREATLKLMPNVQFVYELHLAALEVASFADDWRIGDDYRRFVIGGESADSVRECINSFTGDGYRFLHNIDKIIYGLYNVMLRESILIFEKPR